MRRRFLRLSFRRAPVPRAPARNPIHFTAAEHSAWLDACCALQRFNQEFT